VSVLKATAGTDTQIPLGIPSDEQTTVQPPSIARKPDILGLVARELAGSGVAGETRIIKLLYLIVTSRLLPRPCSVAVKAARRRRAISAGPTLRRRARTARRGSGARREPAQTEAAVAADASSADST